MLLRPQGMPSCESDDVHKMVAEQWISETSVHGFSPIIGLSGENMISETATQRTCEADTIGLDGGQHHMRYVISHEPKHTSTVKSVTMIR